MNGQTIKIKPNLIQKIGGMVILPLEGYKFFNYEKKCFLNRKFSERRG